MEQALVMIQIEKERWDRAVEVADGFWIIATRHRPGGSRHTPVINNRCLVFRLNDQSAGGDPVLVVINAVDRVALPEVQRIAAETGLPIRYLVPPGGGHSLMLEAWHDALPDTRILVGPARIPRLAAGRKLAGSPRFGTLDPIEPLPQFKGQVAFVNFDGLLASREIVTPKEGGKDTLFALLTAVVKSPRPTDPIDELWLYHVASKTIFGGENLGWMIGGAERAAMPFLFRLLVKPDKVYLFSKTARGIGDAGRVKANWQQILAWPAENVFTYHDTIGTGCIGGGQAALRSAVEAAKQL